MHGCGEGCTGRLNDLWEFDPAANRWRQLPSSLRKGADMAHGSWVDPGQARVVPASAACTGIFLHVLH